MKRISRDLSVADEIDFPVKNSLFEGPVDFSTDLTRTSPPVQGDMAAWRRGERSV
jgi:hypothetical protein